MKKSKELSIQNGSTKYPLINKFWINEINIRTDMLTHIKEENDFLEMCYQIHSLMTLTAAKMAQDVEFRSALLELQKK